MSEIRKILLIIRGQIREDIVSPRLWAGYIIGCMMLMGSVEYLNYSKGQSVQICEAFLAALGNIKVFYATYFGLLVIISDAPYLSKRTQGVVMRITRSTWRRAMMIYVILQSFVYYMGLAAFSMIISIPYAYSGNVWSKVFKQATQIIPAKNSGLSFLETASSLLMNFASPWRCMIISLLLMSLYGGMLALIVFLLNFKFVKAVGIGGALLVHLSSFAAVRGYILVSPRCIPGAYASLETVLTYASQGISILYAVIFFGLTYLILEIVIKVFVKYSDFNI